METTTAPAGRTAAPTRWPLLAACLGYFMVILDVTVVTVANPTIGQDLHTTITTLQWVVDGYTMVFAGLLLLAGGLGDRYGARRAFLAGLVVFTAASVACAAAPGPVALVVARLVQGAGAALLVPASLSLLHGTFRDGAARARAIGVWGMMGGVAAAAGPVLGGLLVAGLGWRSIFLVNVPVGALAHLLTARTVPPDTARPGGSARRGTGAGLDLPAQAAAVVMLAAVTGGLIQAGELGWGSPVVLGALVVGVAALVGFVVLERRSRAPMLPLRLFRAAPFGASVVIGVLLNFGFYGLLFVAPLYFERQRHTGVLLTGLSILPLSAVVAVSSALAGRVTARTGPRPPMVVGLLTGAAGLAGWLLAGPDTPYPVLVAPMVAAGFGIAFAMPASTTAIMRTAGPGRAGITSAAFNTARQLGSALGVAVYGTLAASGLVTGVHAGALVGAAGYLVAALCAVLFIPA